MGDGAKEGRLWEAERRIFLLVGGTDDRDGVDGVEISMLRLRPLLSVKDDCRDLNAIVVTPRMDEIDEFRVLAWKD